MSYAVNPKRIEDEVFERLNYGDPGGIDQFTLRRLRYGVEKVLGSSAYSERTFIALGLVLFNMGEYEEFLEQHERGRRFYPNSLLLHTHKVVGMLRMVNSGVYDIPDFDLYTAWFDPGINTNNDPFIFSYGSKKLSYAGNTIYLRSDNVAKISLSVQHILAFEFGPITFIRDYHEVKDEGMNFDEEFTWEVIERIRTGKILQEEIDYLRDILGKNYDTFLKLVDPDYSSFLDNDDKSSGEESYSSVDKLMESFIVS